VGSFPLAVHLLFSAQALPRRGCLYGVFRTGVTSAQGARAAASQTWRPPAWGDGFQAFTGRVNVTHGGNTAIPAAKQAPMHGQFSCPPYPASDHDSMGLAQHGRSPDDKSALFNPAQPSSQGVWTVGAGKCGAGGRPGYSYRICKLYYCTDLRFTLGGPGRY